MRYLSLALIAIGALFMPFAARRAILGLSDTASGDLRRALILLVIGLIFIGAGIFIAKRDNVTTTWRSRKSSRRIRL